MGIKKLSWTGVLALILCVAPAYCDTIIGNVSAGFQSWAATNLTETGHPYWDNSSMDGPEQNVGYYLINALTAPLPGAPGPLPFWGNAFDSSSDTGGSADQNFYFQRTAPTSTAILELEVAGRSNINEFGWYDITDTTTLHPLFLGPDVALASSNFSPTADYGLYIKSGSDVYFTQSSLNSGGDTTHQHFAVFQESSTTGFESYWIGVEDLSVNGLGANEGGAGDYNDMLIHLSVFAVPEPSTAMLVLSGSILVIGLARRRSAHARDQKLRQGRGAAWAQASSPHNLRAPRNV